MRILLILLSLLITACSSSLPSIKPYKMPIQQGNLITSKMMMQLKPGMTKPQVRYIMGTPLITDSFHKDQWDYFYQIEKDGAIIEQRRVIVIFEKDLLAKVKGDVIPAPQNFNAERQEVTFQKNNEIYQKPDPKEKGMLDRLKFWEKDDEKPIEKLSPAKKEVSMEERELVTPRKVVTEPSKVLEPEIKKAPEIVKPEVSKVENSKPLPAKTNLDYFDLMLEKIGF